MSGDRKAFYRYHATRMEPWDGPASIAFTDGTVIGAVLDRNGLRPSRYLVTSDGLVVMASETGVIDVPQSSVVEKGRLQPGRMFLIDTAQGRIVRDDEIKDGLASARPYQRWLDQNLVQLDDLPRRDPVRRDEGSLIQLQQVFGHTHEEHRLLLAPMAIDGKEALGSMGTDTPPAVLSDRNRPIYDFFKQLFAQVTNPPLDAIREELVTSLFASVGAEGNIFDPQPSSCRTVHLDSPVITDEELARLVGIGGPGGLGDFRTEVLGALYVVADGGEGLRRALDGLREAASAAIVAGANILVVSDRGSDERLAPVPSLLAVSAVHQHLVAERTRTQVGLVSESGDAREVHHLCLHLGYGANAVNPYLAFETISNMVSEGLHGLDPSIGGRGRPPQLHQGRVRGHPQGDVQDGHLHGGLLHGRPDLRGHWAGVRAGGRVLHRHHQPPRRHRSGGDRGRGGGAPPAGLPGEPDQPGPSHHRGRRGVPVAARGRVPPVQPRDGVQAPARHPRPPLRHLPGVHPARRRPVEPPGHGAGAVPVPRRGAAAGAHRGGRAGLGDRQALRHRGHELRLDLQGGPRDPGHRHEPHRGQVQHRRGR